MYKKIIKFMILIIIVLINLILIKLDKNYKKFIYENVYSKNLSFAQINNWYKLNIGNLLPIYEPTSSVFKEKIKYKSYKKYKDGVELEVNYDYLVPSLDDGIVIFKGIKEDYGKTIIIQQENGIDVWYSNLKDINLNIYDYIKQGDYIGFAENKLYLVFTKNGDVLDYKKYI